MLSRFSLFAALNALATTQAQSLSDVLAGNSDLSILASLADKLDLGSMLNNTDSNYTILAPTNAAFGSLDPNSADATTLVNGVALADLLSYHVVTGQSLMSANIGSGGGNITPTLLTSSSLVNLDGAAQVVNPVKNGSVIHVYSGQRNGSLIVTPDITFDGGVIHTIDHLLAVPANISTTSSRNSSLNLKQFVSALGTANVSSGVNTMANLTIFVPTTAAFSTANINTPEVDPTRLEDIINYHVVSAGQVMYSQNLMALANNTNLTTIEGKPLTIHFNGSQILVNNATISTTNVLIKNGVIHVLNQLLNPDSEAGFKGGFKPKPNAAISIATPTYVFGLAVAVAAFLM